MKLSPDQGKAARRLGQDVCVVAGPGAGKTRVLIERFCWLVREQQVRPDRVLAVTFTEKATTNIKRRLVEEFQDDSERRRQIERAYVSTIHGFCTRLLRENAVAAGVDVEFGVLDEARGRAILREAAGEALDALFEEKPDEVRRILGALHVSTSAFGRQADLAESLISVYEATRVAGVSVSSLEQDAPTTDVRLADVVNAVADVLPETAAGATDAQERRHRELAGWLETAGPVDKTPPSEDHLRVLAAFSCNLRGVKSPLKDRLAGIRDELIPTARVHLVTELYAPLRTVLIEALARLDTLYRERKRALAALDFSDLEEGALGLLRSRPDVRGRIQARFDYILMDELQDTNPLQWQILDLVRRRDRFFAVGDINQSIYSFRHADPDVFRRYRDSLEAAGREIDELKENHRSRAEILETTQAMTTGLEGVEPRELVAVKEFPPADGPVVEAIVAHDYTTDHAARKEARWIARRIREMQAEVSGQFSRIAVLARKRDSLKLIEEALREHLIPCLVVGGRTLLESREVRDLTQLLAVVANTRDEISLAGVLRSPLAGVHDETLLRLKQGGGLWQTLAALDDRDASGIAEEDVERLGWLRDLLRRLRSNRDAVSPDRLLACIIDESDYEGGLDARARGNVEKFLALVRDLHQDSPRPLAELLDDLGRLRQAASESEAPPSEASNAVQLMTIHGAKGLEFPVVFLAALHKGTSGGLDPVCYSPGHGFGVKWRDPATQEGVGDIVYQAAGETLKQKTADEQDRLLYVAMTRAEQRLVLSCSTAPRARGSEWSRLLEERLELDHDGADVLEDAFPPPATAVEEHEELLERPVVTGQHDSAVSVTRLTDFVACPRKYYLAHYLGFQSAAQASRPVNAPSSRSAAEIGTQVHQLLAGVDVEDPDPEAVRLVGAFRTSELARRIESARGVEREFDFVMELEDVVLRGQIDVWFSEGDELVLVDYKTDRLDPDRETERLEPYALQLRLYALALRKLTGKLPRHALLHFLRSGRTVPIAIDEAALDAAGETVRAVRAEQDRLEFPLKEGEQCKGCQFHRGMCPAGGPS